MIKGLYLLNLNPFRNTVFPHIVAAATILFWKWKWGNYSREETIQRRKLLFYGNFWHFDITHKLCQWSSIDVFTTQNIEILAKILKKALCFMVMCLEIFFWIQMMQFAWPNQIKYNCGGKRENCLREENYSSEETI